MKLTLNNWSRVALVFVCFSIAIFGFMIKLPSSFRRYDKELHSLFYFLAAAFLNLLFTNRKLARHILIFGLLYLFGMCIEYAQGYSNKLLHSRIHGRYDVEDVQANLKGLLAYSAWWILYVGFWFVYDKLSIKEVVNKNE